MGRICDVYLEPNEINGNFSYGDWSDTEHWQPDIDKSWGTHSMQQVKKQPGKVKQIPSKTLIIEWSECIIIPLLSIKMLPAASCMSQHTISFMLSPTYNISKVYSHINTITTEIRLTRITETKTKHWLKTVTSATRNTTWNMDITITHIIILTQHIKFIGSLA